MDRSPEVYEYMLAELAASVAELAAAVKRAQENNCRVAEPRDMVLADSAIHEAIRMLNKKGVL